MIASRKRQRGYLLVTVIVMLFLIASIAMLLNYDSAISANTASGELEASRVEFVTEAAMQHALWRSANNACMGDVTIPTMTLGPDTYTVTVTGASPGTSYVLSADQDAWIRNDDVTKVNGTTVEQHIRFETGNSEHTLTRFDLSSIPANAQINSATAWFYITPSGPGGGAHPEGPVGVHRVTHGWTEADATWDTMNGKFESGALAMIPAQADDDVWVSINLTAQVQAWTNGQSNYGVLMASSTEGTHGKYSSREDGGNAPRLEVVVGSGPASPVAIQATGTLANGNTRVLQQPLAAALQTATIIGLQPDAAESNDAEIWAQSPNNNYGDSAETWVSSKTNDTTRSLLRFNMSKVPAGSKILGAFMSLHRQSGGGGDQPVSAHRITQAWSEDSVTWNDREFGTNWDTAGGDFDTNAIATTPVGVGDQHYEWDIAPLVQAWVDGSYPNYGVALSAAIDGMSGKRFYTSDQAIPELRPRLTITYACECGSTCMAPNGSGKVLMVVINPTTLVAEDAFKKALFESWGYAVDVISESANKSTYDGAIATSDVVFISGTVNSAQVGTKLVNATIGVVSQDGDYNADLGFSSGSASPVGSTINISDNSHYITLPFTAGTLNVYSAAMNGLAVAGAPAFGLQTLGDWSGSAGPVVLDAGAAMSGGGTAAGRRVLLPIGAGIDFALVNNNGLLIMQRALAWGMNADAGSGGSVLLVVVNPDNLTAQEAAKSALIESWSFAVTLIDESASQAEFDAAVATVDVAYVAEEIVSGNLGTKLREANVGVVIEEQKITDEFGISSGETTFTEASIEVTDNTHYITAPFSLGAVTFATTAQTVGGRAGTLAPGLTVLALKPSSTTSMLDVIETGAVLFDSGAAAGPRVKLPWGGNDFDINSLTPDGQTIMKRAIEWGAGGPQEKLVAHWKFDDASGLTALDSEGGHDGTLLNGPAWVPGKLDTALDFDGSDDVVEVPQTSDLDLSTFTVAAWIRISTITTSQTILEKRDGADLATVNYLLLAAGDEITWAFYDGGWASFSTNTANMEVDTWYHVAGTFDNSSGEGNVYVNGVLLATGTTTKNPPLVPGTVRIGDSGCSTCGDEWNGSLDDVRIYSGALDAAAIAELAAPPASSPIAHWKLDETSGTTAIDSVGGHDGTLVNMDPSTDWVTGMVGGGLDFDANNDYVDLTSDAGLDNVFADGATVTAWIYPRGWGESANGRILDKASAVSGDRDGWMIGLRGATPALQFAQGFTGTRGFWRSQDGTVSLNTWVHVAVVYDASSVTNDAEIYLDGVKQSSLVEITPTGAIASDAGIALRMGNYAQGASRTFDGIIDNVRIYGRMLDAAEIAAIAGAGGGGFYLDEFPDFSCDGADEYSGSNGTIDWSGAAWSESGDDGRACGANLRVVDDPSIADPTGNRLRLQNKGRIAEREVDLSSFSTAFLSFDYRRDGMSGAAAFDVSVSANGGSSWTPLDSIGAGTDADYLSASYDISAYIAANTMIQFSTNSNFSNEAYIDNVRLDTSGSGSGGGSVPTIFEVRVATGNDDAEQRVSSGSVNLSSSDLELIADGSNDQLVGMRFTNVTVPNGATISSAYTQFQVDETNSGATSVNIQAQDIDDAPTFSTSSNNISSRSRTSASVAWAPAAWSSVGEAGPDQRTPNIKAVIQEIVNRPGWASGNDMVIIITGSGERTAEAYNGSSSGAALLHIEY